MNATQGYGRPSSMTAVVLKFVFTTSLVMFVILLDKSISSQIEIPQVFHQAFRFHVHCPIQSTQDGSFLYLMNYLNITDAYSRNKIFKELIQQTTYVVFVQASSAYVNDSTNGSVLLSYCGNARLKNETDCSQAKLMCTVPGPIFEAYVHQSIRVIWINDVNPEGLNWTEADQNCYGNNSDSIRCTVGRRIDGVSQDCTYFKQTNMSTLGISSLRINNSAVPIAPHVHGIETRPAFDGNPLGWFNNIGQKGPGYFSLSTNEYFNSFFPQGKTFLQGLISSNQARRIKVAEYKHQQPPGILYYHDHAMAVSLSNYVRGSLGFYMIYDPQQEEVFPKNEEDYIFAFHFFNQGDLRDSTDRQYMGGSQYPYVGPIQDSTFLYGSEYVYRNMTYRWRFLNAHYDTTYINISFAVFYEVLQDERGYFFINETEPPLNVDPQTFLANMHKLSFTVLGTDSAMFSNAVNGVDQFNLAVAQRMQILIKYDQVPQNVSKVYVVCYDVRDSSKKYTMKLELTLLNVSVENKYRDPEKYNELNVSFTNLRNVPSQQIVAKRMRALFSRPDEGIFTINQHYQYTQARSENPKIGTIQDWYIINTVHQVHPIHFHLINFQVVQTYLLKESQGGCTLYELDFFRQSNISIFQIDDNDQLCSFLKTMSLDQMMSCIQQFNSYVLEDQFINGISGKDVMERITFQTNTTQYEVPNCPLGNEFKYICQDTTADLPVYEYGWKDTAGVSEISVFVLRIRWTKTLFDPYLQNDPYFNQDESMMIQFPGTLYHCHMFIHADKRMMRPIELQPSDRFLATHSSQNYQCNLDTWQQRYQCINQVLNCPF